MPVGRRRGLILGHHPVHVGQPPQQAEQPRIAGHDDPGAAPSHQRRVTRVLDRVAQALLAVEQNRLPAEVLPLPLASRCARRAAVDAVHLTIAVGPGHGVASRQEVGAAASEARLATVRFDRQRRPAARQPLLETALVYQALGQRREQRRRVGIPDQARAQLLLVLVEAPQLPQDGVQIPAEGG